MTESVDTPVKRCKVLEPSKLASAANQVWNESASLFHKKTDVKIDFGLDKATHEKPGVSQAKTTTSSSITAGYIFGSRVGERVAKSETDTPNDVASADESTAKPKDVSSIFMRMANASSSKDMWKTSTNTTAKDKEESLVTSGSDRLQASADEFAKKSMHETELNSVEPVTTGEEDERNMMNASCKFFYFNTDTKSWIERGLGTLRVNQKKNNQDNIRIVGRTTGSQRVVLNSKIFPTMLLEQLTDKRIKISAHCQESDLPQLFVIQATPSCIANLYHTLEQCLSRCQRSANRKRKATEPEKDKEGQEEEGVNED